MKMGTWLMALVEPMLGRILTALGLSVVSIQGMDVALGQLRQMMLTNLMGVGVDVLNVFLLAGGGQALGILMGAVSTRLFLWQLKNATQILGKTPG
jgi:flagellar biosynthesis/type III secretory pathway ATPase